MKPWEFEKASRRAIAPDDAWAAAIRRQLYASCHPHQLEVVRSQRRFFTMLVGRGGTKTTTFKVKFIDSMAHTPRGRFLFVAPTREMGTELLWDPLKETCERLGIEADFKEVARTCTFRKNGARLKFVGGDDRKEMGKQRGQPFDGVGFDEICEVSPELVAWFVDRIITPRLGERRGWFGLGSTPGHILRGLFYEATRPGGDLHIPSAELARYPEWDGWVSFAWSLADIAALPDAAERYPAVIANWVEALATKKRNAWADDHPIWMREYKGLWAADDTENVFKYRPHVDGKPHNEWDPPRGGELAVLPEDIGGWLYFIALDEGQSDPFAANVFALSPNDPTRTLYHLYGFERGGRRLKPGEEEAVAAAPEQRERMYARTIAQLLIGEALQAEKPGGLIGAIGEWPVAIEADANEALLLELQNVYGIRVTRFDRSHKYKIAAIEVVNGDLVDGKIKILKGSPLAKQLGELQWARDQWGNVVENKAQANHSTDTLLIARRCAGSFLAPTGDQVPPGGAARHLSVTPPASSPDHGDYEKATNDGGISGMLVGHEYHDPWGMP